MPKVFTKTANSYTTNGVRYSRDEPVIVGVEEAVRLMKDEYLRVEFDDGDTGELRAILTGNVDRTEKLSEVQQLANQVAALPASDAPATPAQTPAVTVDPLDQVIEAITRLDIDNEAHFTRAGLPDARALSAMLGRQVTAAERDAAVSKASGNKVESVEAQEEAAAATGETPAVKGGIKIVTKPAAPDTSTEGAVTV